MASFQPTGSYLVGLRDPQVNPIPPQAVTDLLREVNRPQSSAWIDRRLDLVDHSENQTKDIPYTPPIPVCLTIMQLTCSLSTLWNSTPERTSMIWPTLPKESLLKFTTSGMPTKQMANHSQLTTLKFFFTGKPSLNLRQSILLMGLEIQSRALDVSTLRLLN